MVTLIHLNINAQDIKIELDKPREFIEGLNAKVRIFEGQEILQIYRKPNGTKSIMILCISISERSYSVDNWPASPYHASISFSKIGGEVTVDLSFEKGEKVVRGRIIRKEKLLYIIKKID
jgi:hypothetical protein